MDVDVSALLPGALILAGAKRTMLAKVGDSVRTLVVGSSHGDFGFNPHHCPGAFNLCCRSQDLKHSFHLYRRLAGELKNLDTVVVVYSVFSPGNDLEKSPSEREIAVALNELFGLGIEYSDDYLRVLSGVMAGKNDALEVEMEDGYYGFLPTYGKGYMPEAYWEGRVQGHLRLSRVDDGIVYLRQMIALAQDLGHRLLVLIPPARSDYTATCMASTDNVFESLYQVLDELGIDKAQSVLNLFNDPRFADSDFGDSDHLLPSGAGAVTLSTAVKDALDRMPTGPISSRP